MSKAQTWFAVFVVLLAFHAYRLRRAAHNTFSFPKLPKRYSAAHRCQLVEKTDTLTTFEFCEDGTLWDPPGTNLPTRAKLLISCDPGRKAWNTVMGPLKDPNPRGSLWIYDPESAAGASSVSLVTIEGFPESSYFHPLGLDVITQPSSNTSDLFVINHSKDATTVEQFALSSRGVATYSRTLTSPFFRSPNSIALTSSTSFYLTHDHLFTRRMPFPAGNVLPVLETMLALPLGWINHVDIGTNGKLSLSWSAFGVPFANGIAISPSGKEVAVSSSSSQRVFLYGRDLSSNHLKYRHSLEIPFSPDNLSYESSGALIVAGHPHLPSLQKVARNQTGSFAPSWVISIRSTNSTCDQSHEGDHLSIATRAQLPLDYCSQTLYQSDGSDFQTSSTGIVDPISGSTYVLGLYEKGIMVCE